MVPLPKEGEFKKKVLDYATNENFGLEIQAFVDPNDFSNKKKVLSKIKEYKKMLDQFPNFYSIHGPIFDIKPHTVDNEIMKIVKKRVDGTLSIAERIGCKRVIFHTGVNPLISAKREKEFILSKQAEFWDHYVNKYESITICLENMWDFTPVFLKLLMKKVDHERLKICLDTGHLNVYSKSDIDIWFEELKDYIVHMHLHDNYGESDKHNAIGDGNTEWKKVFSNINRLEINPKLLLEIDSEEKFFATIKYFKKNDLLND